MINLNNEERAIKIKSASFALKKYFDYFKIESNQKDIYDKISTGNSFVNPRNLVEYANDRGVKLETKSFSKEEFWLFEKSMFPIIAVVTKGHLDTYIFIKDRTKDTLIVVENDEEEIITFEEFFARSRYECIVSKNKKSYIDFNFITTEFVNIVKDENKLVYTLGAQILFYVLISVLAIISINLIPKNILDDSSVLLGLMIISVVTICIQMIIFSQSRQVINGISFIVDTLKIDRYIFEYSKILGDENLTYAHKYIEKLKKESVYRELSSTNLVLTVVVSTIVSSILLIFMAIKSFYLFVILVCYVIITVVITLKLGDKINLESLENDRLEKNYFNYLKNITDLAKINKLICENEDVNKIKNEKFGKFAESSFKVKKLDTVFKSIIDFMIVLATITVVGVNYNLLSVNENKAIETFILIVFYLLPFIIYFRQLALKLYDKAKVEYEYSAIKHCEESIANYKDKAVSYVKPKAIFENSIDIKNLHFEFFHKKAVLKNINIKIQKGKKVLIYGSSGSGKTVLANILLQNLEPIKGEILIDNRNIKRLDISEFEETVVMVPEKIRLFNATILENITMFEKISMKRVVNICKALGIHSEIQKKPFNYKTIIDVNNNNLSELEMKKIALARAVLKKPRILVIDGLTDVFEDEDIIMLNDLLNEDENIETVVMFSRNVPSKLDYDTSYKINKGVVVQKN